MHCASCPDVVKLLAGLKADVNRADNDGDSPFRMKIKFGLDINIGVLKALVEVGADPNPSGKGGQSVREIAEAKGLERTMAFLDGLQLGKKT